MKQLAIPLSFLQSNTRKSFSILFFRALITLSSKEFSQNLMEISEAAGFQTLRQRYSTFFSSQKVQLVQQIKKISRNKKNGNINLLVNIS
jgi:hypothetical protein